MIRLYNWLKKKFNHKKILIKEFIKCKIKSALQSLNINNSKSYYFIFLITNFNLHFYPY